MITRIYALIMTGAAIGLSVAYSYERAANIRYETGQLVNAGEYQRADWITLVEGNK